MSLCKLFMPHITHGCDIHDGWFVLQDTHVPWCKLHHNILKIVLACSYDVFGWYFIIHYEIKYIYLIICIHTSIHYLKFEDTCDYMKISIWIEWNLCISLWNNDCLNVILFLVIILYEQSKTLVLVTAVLGPCIFMTRYDNRRYNRK